MKGKKVAVGMSGGVDSSVAAYLLKKAGYDVLGLFMKNWEEEGGDCPAREDREDVARVCDHLSIPFYTINFSKEYFDEVFQDFLEGFKKGYTPNPDIACNRQIKFSHFLEHAKKLGAFSIATGHYCQLRGEGEEQKLIKGKDREKDQSYFLHDVAKEAFSNVLFPIGHLTKSEVRKIAKKAGLATFNKKDSTGICFIGKRSFRPFLQEYIPKKEGNIVSVEGTVLGKHEGAYYYTIGQRKGLGIGGPGEPFFVVGKDMEKNEVIVAQGENHIALYSHSLRVKRVNWLTSISSFPYKCHAKVRYRQTDQECTIEKEGEGFFVTFRKSQRGVAPGQSVVFYEGEVCLGGGVIEEVIPIVRREELAPL